MPQTEPHQGLRRHKLVTAEARKALPPLYSQDGKGQDALVYLKLFGPGRITLYVTEFDGEDTFFGYMLSPLGEDCDEFGYSSLAELASIFRGYPLIERDCYWDNEGKVTVRECVEGRL